MKKIQFNPEDLFEISRRVELARVLTKHNQLFQRVSRISFLLFMLFLTYPVIFVLQNLDAKRKRCLQNRGNIAQNLMAKRYFFQINKH